METASLEKKRFGALDAAAVALFIAAAVCLFYTAITGFGPVDESFYYTVVQRWLDGDRLLIDDWHFEQLTSFLQILPFWLFRRVTGSTEGVILYLRFLAMGVALALYWFFYARMCRYGVWGLLSVFLFAVYVPLTILTLNYYTMSLNGLLVVCSLLFLGKEKKHPATLIFSGIVFACVVVSEPFVAFVYFGWSALVLLRTVCRKRGKSFLSEFSFILNGRSWLFLSIGVALTAAVFLVWFLLRSPLPEVLATLPEMLNDTEYAVGDTVGSSIFQPGKLIEVVRYFGIAPPVCGAAVLILGLVCRKKGVLLRWRGPLFVAACVCLAAAYVSAAVITARVEYLRGGYAPTMLYYYYYQHAPLLLFGPVCYVLCERQDRRLLCIMLLGLFSSAMIDLASEIVLGFGGAVAMPAALIVFGSLLRELRETGFAPQADTAARAKKTDGRKGGKNKKKNKKRTEKKKRVLPSGKRVLVPAAALALVCLIGWEGFGVYTHVGYPLVEGVANTSSDKEIRAAASRGPLKGIRTTARINGLYEDMLSDLDVIKEGEDGPVYVTKLISYLYLYLERPLGSYYGWYVEGESETRQLRYWELHPEKRPAYIYLPTYDYLFQSYRDMPATAGWEEEKISFLESLCECEITRGKAGVILHVIRWK